MTDSELTLVAKLNQQLQIDEGARLRMSVEQIEARLRGWLAERYRVFIGRHDGEVVGYLICIEEDDPCPPGRRMMYIRQLFVTRDARRQGFGRAIVERFIVERVPEGMPVEMDVLTNNTNGRAFWEAVGFVPRLTRMRRER